MAKKTVTIKIDADTERKLRADAVEERRSFSSQVALILEKYLKAKGAK